MGIFGFGKTYSKQDLQKEITKLQNLYRQAIGADPTSKSRSELKRELAIQLHEVLDICKKGNFYGMEMVEWCPDGPSSGNFTSLRNVTPLVQTYIEIM